MIGRACVVSVALLVGGCAARAPARPTMTPVPDEAVVATFRQATSRCQGLRTMTAELRLSGRLGGERARGTLHAGLEAPASVRVEALAPFGQPFFILAGRDNRATLLLPRDDRVLSNTPVQSVLDRLIGVPLSADELRLALTGCVGALGEAAEGRIFGESWRAVSAAGATVFLRPLSGVWTVVAADHGEWRVDYTRYENGWPRAVRLRSVTGDVDVTAIVGELEINTDIDARAFDVTVPADAVPISLDELSSVRPLKATR